MEKKNYQWYILTIRGGREAKVIEEIKSELAKKGWSDYLRELKVISDSHQKNILKGYILAHCHLTPELMRFFSKFRKTIRFLNYEGGSDKLPEFLSEEMINTFLAKMLGKQESRVVSQRGVDLNIGDLVKITAGTFINREGRITHFDQKKQKVKIVIEPSGWEISDVPVNICQKVIN